MNSLPRVLLVISFVCVGCTTLLGINGDYALNNDAGTSGATGEGGIGSSGGADGSGPTPTIDAGPILPSPNPPGPAQCTESPRNTASAIHDECAIFVAPNGAEANAGTRNAPVLTINQGIAKAIAAKKRVYVCNAKYTETVAPTGAVDVFGGFVCPGVVPDFPPGEPWTYIADSAPQVTSAAAGAPALRVKDVKAVVRFEDMSFVAAAPSEAQRSTIAAVVIGTQRLSLARVKLLAGNAHDGKSLGAQPTAPSPAPKAGAGGTNSPTNTCTCATGGGNSVGGASGPSGCSPLGGARGAPTYTPSVPAANTGGGGSICSSGTAGSNGTNGANGNAGDVGTLGDDSYVPKDGTPGVVGNVGQGGGGGGCLGGGAGGCGGCGGGGGPAGSGGGASIGIFARSSTIEFTACAITTGIGGAGGAGLAGGAGADGANGGTGSGCSDTTKGGNGGKGGSGGEGGGGAGGPSACVVYKTGETAPALDAATTCTKAAGGAAGGGPRPGRAGASEISLAL